MEDFKIGKTGASTIQFVATLDLAALRAEREWRTWHHMLAHLRTEAYAQARRPMYPAGLAGQGPLTVAGNGRATELCKEKLGKSL